MDIPINYVARPVVGAWDRSGVFHNPTVHGTAFPVAGGLYFTAHHVVTAIEEVEKTLLIGHYPVTTTPGVGAVEFHRAVVFGRWPKLDIAAIMVTGQTTSRALQWRAGSLNLLAPVRCVGYPWGVEIDQYTQQKTMFLRAFAGHVVSSCRATNVPHLPGDPLIYELSFTAHLGVSGAALLTGDNEIAGCVVKNRTISGGGDVMSLGLAVQSSALLDLRIEDTPIRDLVLKCGGSIR